MLQPIKCKALRYSAVPSVGICILLMALAGCATLDQIIQKPAAVFRGVQLTDASLLQSTAVFDFDISNPNPVGIYARRINYNLKLNGKHFIRGKLDRGISLAAGSTSRMSIPVTLQYLDFYQSVSRLWQNKSAAYAFSGSFSVGPFVVPFQAQGRLSLPQRPRIDLEAIQIKKYSPLGATLNCRLRLDNPNAFNLLFKRLDYDFKLGGTPFARASARPQGPVAKNSRSVIDLGLHVSFVQLGRSAYQLLQGARADYSLNGGLVFDTQAGAEHQVPFRLSGRVPFLR